MKKLHLDNIYRDRWQEYHLADGTIKDSRRINWRLVDWDRVVQVVTVIRDKKYVTHCKHPDFRFFMCFRWGGINCDNGQAKKIREWAVGWSNGENCFMSDLDFQTGELLRQYVIPVDEVKNHIHPRVKKYVISK